MKVLLKQPCLHKKIKLDGLAFSAKKLFHKKFPALESFRLRTLETELLWQSNKLINYKWLSALLHVLEP